MASAAQILSNRQNAKHSTGPRTPEGKQTASLNSLRHGLTSQTVVLPTEDAEAYAALRASIFHDYAPANAEEQILTQTIADTQWRLERARTLEANLFALAHYEEPIAALAAIADPQQRHSLIAAQGYEKRERIFRNLQLQEGRLQRTLFKAMADLRQVQQTRKAERHQQLEEALNTRIDCKNNGLPFNPKALGFDFTEADLDREQTRRHAHGSLRKRPALQNSQPETEIPCSLPTLF